MVLNLGPFEQESSNITTQPSLPDRSSNLIISDLTSMFMSGEHVKIFSSTSHSVVPKDNHPRSDVKIEYFINSFCRVTLAFLSKCEQVVATLLPAAVSLIEYGVTALQH